MKIVAYSYQRKTSLGVLEKNGIVDAGTPADLIALLKQDPGLKKLHALPKQGPLIPLDQVKLLAPVANPSKIVCVGLNYLDHCKENNLEVPKTPVLFAKFPSALIGPQDHIVHPAITQKLDFEVELALIISQTGKKIPEDKAMNYVAGFTIGNDVSARDIQFGDSQWVRGKSLDSFAPLGPWLVTPDEIGDPHRLAIQCRLNGQVVQNSNTDQMIFKVPFLISFISQAITLNPGDVIITGTPSGVGAFKKPPLFMKPGDVVEVEIEKIGKMSNKIVTE